MSMSNYLEGKLLDYVLKATAYSAPTGRYLALFNTDPTDAGTGTEIAGNGYLRQSVAFNASVNGSSSNSADVTFPVSTGSWGSIAYVGIYDAVTAGNLLFSGNLLTPQTVVTNNQLIFKAGQITITLD